MPDWRWVHKLRLRLRSLFQRDHVERELEDEIRSHIEQRIEHEIAGGQTPAEARYAALRAMGGIEQRKEACRDARRVRLVETFLQDVGYTFRGIRKNPAFSSMAVLTLGLGIGASMAILPVVHAVLVRPLPFPNAGELVALYATTPLRSRDVTSFPDFTDWKQQSRVFAAAAAYRRDPMALTGGGPPEPITALRVSHEIFNVLGMNPAMGRGFDQREQQSKAAVVLISDALWRRRFGGDSTVLGKTILLGEAPHVIIGVLPPAFQFPPFLATDVILPVLEDPGRGRGYLRAVARLKKEISIATAQRELNAIASRLEAAYPLTNKDRGARVMPLQQAAAGDLRTPLLVLMGAALFVLLIGCANVGNLALARSIARQREFALRSALGAGSGRLARQLLTESTLLALLAALAGSVIAFCASHLLVFGLSQQFALPEITFDWGLLGFAVSITLLSGVLCGLPAVFMVWRSMVWRSRLGDSLKEGGRSQSSGPGEHRLRSLLIVSETALTVVLLAGSGLLLRSFLMMRQTDLGLNPRNALMVDLLLSKRNAEPERRELFLNQLLESVGSLPQVKHVAVHTDPPFLGGGSRQTFNVEGHADPGPRVGHAAAFNVVSNDFFAAMGIPIQRGRGFDARDTPGGAPVAVINENMARRFWPAQNAVGKRIKLYYDKDPQRWLLVVGVTGDVRYHGWDREPGPQVFVPHQQDPHRALPRRQEPFPSLVIRTEGDPATLRAAIQRRIWAIDPDQPILKVQTLEDALGESVASRQLYLPLLGSFAVVAFVMAAAGIYGLVSYTVARRTQEMGIRIALGATTNQILALVVRHGMMLTLMGILVGTAASLALTRVIAGLLFRVNATDAPTFVVVLSIFTVVAFVASYIPARRAASVDPAVAFRQE